MEQSTPISISTLSKPTGSRMSATPLESFEEERPKRRNPVTLYAPLWTLVAACWGAANAGALAPTIGALSTMQGALAILMLSMGLTITPTELQRATQQPRVIFLNALLCFGMMPLLALGMARAFSFSPNQTVGTVLLGSVSGGQASNLFSLLAGGDVALSVVCTLTTTMLGVVATPLLVKQLLGCSIAVNASAILRSVASLVLLPLMTGLVSNRLLVRQSQIVRRLCPTVGVLASLILVAGGASNSTTSLFSASTSWQSTLMASVGLPLFGGALALLLANNNNSMPQSSKRTFCIEVLSKSPTLAHVLALQHFGASAAVIPAAAMVSLAVLGALVASVWAKLD